VTAPVCYRHTDRETYIKCSRCERPICPDCMVDASVGFQCPECVREGSRSVRKATTPLGGERRENTNLVTKVLLAINALVWLTITVSGSRDLDERLLLFKDAATGYTSQAGVLNGEWYRMLTATFTHTEIWHIALNMFALWILGSAIEPVLGRWRFLMLYLLSGLGGSVVSLLGLVDNQASLGASGAVFGLFGALFIVARRIGADTSFIVVILAINVVIGFTVPSIDWRAHLGGLVTGTVLALVFAHAPRKHRTAFGVGACVAVFVAIVAVAALLIA
jgi:membrane associated rhomboid family serine protease